MRSVWIGKSWGGTCCAIAGLTTVMIGSAQAGLTLPDGTVTASTYYGGTGLNAYWGESVTTLTIDVENLGPGQYVKVSGTTTNISHSGNSWVEIGLIPKDR